MSLDDQVRWDRQHAQTGGAELPSSFLREIFESARWEIPWGRALDVACGKGRNALFLAELGFEVVAMDISAVALEEGRWRAQERSLAISWQHADLEQIQLPQAAYDLIINFNYLEPSLIPKIKLALRVGGHIQRICFRTTSCWITFASSGCSATAKENVATVTIRPFAR